MDYYDIISYIYEVIVFRRKTFFVYCLYDDSHYFPDVSYNLYRFISCLMYYFVSLLILLLLPLLLFVIITVIPLFNNYYCCTVITGVNIKELGGAIVLKASAETCDSEIYEKTIECLHKTLNPQFIPLLIAKYPLLEKKAEVEAVEEVEGGVEGVEGGVEKPVV